MEYYLFQEKLSEVKLKQAYLEVDNLDSLKAVSQKDTTLSGLFKLMEVLISKGDLAEAQLCRSKIISKEIPHISDECRFLSTRLNLALAGKTWLDMNSTQLSLIEQIYQHNPNTAINARAVLALTKGLKYERYPYDLNFNHSMSPQKSEEETVNRLSTSLKIYPNPSINYTNVEVNINEPLATLSIYNVLGVEIQRQKVYNHEILTLNTSSYKNGIYFFVIETNNGIIEKQKVIISR